VKEEAGSRTRCTWLLYHSIRVIINLIGTGTVFSICQGEGGSGQPHALYLTTWLLYHVIRVMINLIDTGIFCLIG
jgi:hypothetical protein